MADLLLNGQNHAAVARGREPIVLLIQAGVSIIAAGLLVFFMGTELTGLISLGILLILLLGQIGVFYVRRHSAHRGDVPVPARLILALMQGLMLGHLAAASVVAVGEATSPNPSLFGWVALLAMATLSTFDLKRALALLLVPSVGGIIVGLTQFADPKMIAIMMASLSIALLLIFLVARQLNGAGIGAERIQVLGSLSSILLQESARGPQNWAFRTGPKGELLEVTPGFSRATGISRELWVGLNIKTFLIQLASKSPEPIHRIVADIEAGRSFKNVNIEIQAGSHSLHWKISGAPIKDASERLLGYVGANFDITSAKLIESEIYDLAHYDPLTGLINRNQFNFQLDHLVTRMERYGAPFTLLLVDLDHFKNVNDSRGHLVGDQVLTEVADRIRECIRDSDFAGRLGGDEFAILLPDVHKNEDVVLVADRLAKLMQEAFEIEGERIFMGASIGIAMAPRAGNESTQLMRNADVALYRAKAAGRGRFQFFLETMDAEAKKRGELEQQLSAALDKGEMELNFQPVIETATGLPTSFEALLRWNHPTRGSVSPTEFIPIAEHSGMIDALGDWSIDEACRIAENLPSDISVSVNLSSRHFMTTDIVSAAKSALDAHNLQPHQLEIEITETVMAEPIEEVLEKLTLLQSLGIKIAMDDFGTGFSSLSNLLKFPFDRIKIDSSFIEKIEDGAKAKRILNAMVAMGHSLNMAITAEGVETSGQAEFLESIECENMQGFHFARPMRSEELAAYLLRLYGPHDKEADAPQREDGAARA